MKVIGRTIIGLIATGLVTFGTFFTIGCLFGDKEDQFVKRSLNQASLFVAIFTRYIMRELALIWKRRLL